MADGLVPISFTFTPAARRRIGAMVDGVQASAHPVLFSVGLTVSPLDSGEAVETVHVFIEPTWQGAQMRPSAQAVDGLLILYWPGPDEDARLAGQSIDHAAGDGFFLRDPVSGRDNRSGSLGGSDWPNWAARGARLGPLGPQIRWPGMAPLDAVPDRGHAASLLPDHPAPDGTRAPHLEVSNEARAALVACAAACRAGGGADDLTGVVRLDAGALLWLEGALCREVAVVFLRRQDDAPSGMSGPAVEGLSLVFSNTPPGRWVDGTLDYVPRLGFLLRPLADGIGRGQGNDNGGNG
ncbi:hypothetical protein V5F31_15775 [Xanthobacter sp. V7C-4]|uniref:hypothetical protein n=1 Tax=Xanthobacter autotrophicus (strain ATCC BAA-1158 / Py2) TaxID=78245 RepID=UPI003729A435